MPAANPCLGCGFELDADGYLVRIGEVEKQSFLTQSFAPAGAFKYCDPTNQRSWDVPWVMPWGLMDESVTTLSVSLPIIGVGIYQMPGVGPFVPANSLYAPYRRLRLEGWMELGVGANSPVEVNVGVNGNANLSVQLVTTVGLGGVQLPISVGVSGPSLGPWAGYWTTADGNSGKYVQFRIGGRITTGSANGAVNKLGLSIMDDGPASGVFYTVEQRYWPSPLPYP